MLETITPFTSIQLIGFIIMLFGVFLYNELLIVKYWGLADHTQKMIKKREQLVSEE